MKMKNNKLKRDKYNIQLFINTNCSRMENDFAFKDWTIHILILYYLYTKSITKKKNYILISLTIIITDTVYEYYEMKTKLKIKIKSNELELFYFDFISYKF